MVGLPSDQLRRTHIHALAQALKGNHVSLDLGEAAAQAARLQPIPVSGEALEGVLDFVARRLDQLLVDEGCDIEVVKAVLSERSANPSIAAQSARELQVWHCDLTSNAHCASCVHAADAAPYQVGRVCLCINWPMSVYPRCAFLLCGCWMAARRSL